MSIIIEFCKCTYHLFIVTPLRQLYFYGPQVYNIGFWGGMDEYDICQALSPLPNFFWKSHPTQCLEILENKFNSFRITIELLIYFYVLYRTIVFCQTLCLFLICKKHIQQQLINDVQRPLVYHSNNLPHFEQK